jgi:hypothetical protein
MTAASTHGMTRADRAELSSLARQQAKVAKDRVDYLQAERVAEVEEALSAIYRSDDELWKASTSIAKAAIADVSRVLTEQWQASGKPPEFAPQARFAWCGR